MSIKKKVVMFTLVITILTIIQAIVAVHNLNSSAQKSINGVGTAYLVAKICGAGVAANNYLITKDDKYINRFSRYLNGVEERMKRLGTIGKDIGRHMAKVSSLVTEYRSLFQKAVNEIRTTGNTPLESELVRMNEEIIHDMHTASELIEKRIGKIARSAVTESIIGSAIIVMVLIVLGIALIRGIIGPLSHAINMMDDLASAGGDLTKQFPESSDEIGQMAKSINTCMAKVRTLIKNVKEQILEMNDSTKELRIASNKMAKAAEVVANHSISITEDTEKINSNTSTLAAGIEEVTSSVQTIAGNVTIITDEFNRIFGIVQKAQEDIQNMAAAIEELSASANAVAEKTVDAAQISSTVTDKANAAQNLAEKLGESMNVITKVLNVISEIARQTNLLALNATIEAASAGEAGKGFAVVASEVKELSKKTSQSTEEISKQIEEMQTVALEVIRAVQEINEVSNEMNDIVNYIASASEEQSATTISLSEVITQNGEEIERKVKEMNDIEDQSRAIALGLEDISKTMEDMSRSTQSIADDISRVAESAHSLGAMAEENAAAAQEVSANCEELAHQSEAMTKAVDVFKV